jgi:prepilin-type N-terminal cleavage/methylation domain-containing protein
METERPPSAGFSLIELLVAMLIGMTVVLGFAGSSLAVMRANRISEKESHAAAVAQAALASLTADHAAGAALAAGSSSGEFNVAWSMPAIAGVPAGVTVVRVVVSWQTPAPGSLTFDTALDT